MPAHHGTVIPVNNFLRSIEKFRIEVFAALYLSDDKTQNLIASARAHLGHRHPLLTNPVWIYGDDDDTLFRLIMLGTGEAFKEQGYVPKGSEAVVGPMPPFGEAIKTDDNVWKIIAWIRSVNRSGNR
jgi:hypothetical protein